MAKPPEATPNSDIDGVNEDARAGTPAKSHPNPGGALNHADQESRGRPEGGRQDTEEVDAKKR